MKKKNISKLILLGGLCALPASVQAATMKVGGTSSSCGGPSTCTHTTIQSAVDAAQVGDVIEVYPGTYQENVVIDSTVPEIELKRAPGSTAAVIIDGNNSNPPLYIDGEQGEGLKIRGLTLRNGRGKEGSTVGLTAGRYFGGGAFISGASPVLEDLVIEDNTANAGAGLYLFKASPVIRNTRIDGNIISASNAGGGGGIFLYLGSHPQIEDSVISNNTGAVRGGAIFGMSGVMPTLIGTSIRGNSAGYGGGLYFLSGARPSMISSLISGNSSTATTTTSGTPAGGGGVYLYEGVQAYFENVTLADNSVPTGITSGVELFSAGSMPRFINSVIHNAVASQAGKNLLFGYSIGTTDGRPALAGAELRYSNVYAASGSSLGGTYSASNISSSNTANSDSSFEGGGAGAGSASYSYRPAVASPLIDAGDPEALYNDVDGSRNDMGAFGGNMPLLELPTGYNDADGDGIADAWEEQYFGDASIIDSTTNSDGDTLTDAEEFAAGTNPQVSDTDRDGWNDDVELDAGTDPSNAADHRPTLVATRDRVVVAGSEGVTLSAANSVDPDGTALSYAWSLVSKPNDSTLSVSGSASSMTFTPDVAGVYEVRVTVTDAGTAPAAAAASSSTVIKVYAGAEISHSTGALQAVIDAAASYSTITVAPGTYIGTVDFGGKILRIRSSGGAGTTTLQGPLAGGVVVRFDNGEGAASSLEGFTVTGGVGSTVDGYNVGGGVLIQNSSPSLKDVVISNNRAKFGAGVAIFNGSPLFESVTISGNKVNNSTSTPGAGAGVYVFGGAPEFRNCTLFLNDVASSQDQVFGAGLYAHAARITYVGSATTSRAMVDNNRAKTGAGMYLSTGSSITLKYVTFQNNVANETGGALVAYARSQVVADDVLVLKNSAITSGGGFYLSDNSVLKVKNSEFGRSSNVNMSGNGGAIATYNASVLQVDNTLFTANSAGRGGAVLHASAVAANQEDSWIRTSTFIGNAATSSASGGGAVALDNGGELEIIRSKFQQNTATGFGGALALNGGERVAVRNCLLVGNSAATGGAIYLSDATAVGQVVNSTLVSSTGGDGSAIAVLLGGQLSVTNSILSSNSGPYAISGSSSVSVTYSSFWQNAAGTIASGVVGSNNLSADPSFVSYDGNPATSSNNFQLRYLSSLINAGDPSANQNDVNGTRNDLGWEGGPLGINVDYDADDDGLADEQEQALGSNPNSSDSDGDGLSDLAEYNAGTSPIMADTDSDGLSDAQEQTEGTDPLDADTDSDGLTDGDEVDLGIDPNDSDSDDDGSADAAEVAAGTNPLNADSDADGVSDGAEATAGTNPLDSDTDDDGQTDGQEAMGGTNPLDADSDDDGRSDGQEVTAGTNPLDADSDDDTLSDGAEATAGTNPLQPDTDTDGRTDAQELAAGTNPLDSDSDDDGLNDGQEAIAGTNPLQADSDSDGRTDGQEVTAGTNALDADSDDDGRTDGQEATAGTNPLNPDSDADGLTDGEEATAGTNPLASDSDADGLNDWDELDAGLNPNVADTDSDGMSDAVAASSAQRPVASAMVDAACAVSLPCSLDGASGSDPNGDSLSYNWAFVSIPEGATEPTLTNANRFRASFTATVPGTYVVALRSLDGKVQSAADEVTIHVQTPKTVNASGGDYSTIASALSAVSSGTLGSYPVIVVAPGTYRETLTIPAVPFTLMSQDGATDTIIDADTDANGTGNGVTATFTNTPSGVRVKGFTFKNGVNTNSTGGNIRLINSYARLEDNIIRKGSAKWGGGLYVAGGAPELVRNYIVHNDSSSHGGGVYVSGGTARFMNNHFVKNRSTGGVGGAVYGDLGSPAFYFNAFAGNEAAQGVSSLWFKLSAVDIRNNVIVNNDVSTGAVAIYSDAGTVIKSNVFFNNRGYNVYGTYTDSGNFANDNRTTDPKVRLWTKGVSNSGMKDDLRLSSGSSGLDYANAMAATYRDIDGSLPDAGAFGGPFSASWQRVNRVKVGSTNENDYLTISSAIPNLATNDQVHVYAGTYNEVVNFGGRNVTVQGGFGGETIIDGNGKNDAAVRIHTGETSQALLSDFTIINGVGLLGGSTRYGGGIFISSASPTIENCTLYNNSAAYGGAVYAATSDSTMSGLVVRNNNATAQGGGLYFSNFTGMLEQSRIYSNTSTGNGAGVMIQGSPMDIANSLFELNVSGAAGGGIATNSSAAVFTNLIVVENDAASRSGGGMYLNNGNAIVQNSYFGYNQDRGILANGNHTIRYCNFQSNASADFITFNGTFTTTGIVYVLPGFVNYTVDGAVNDNFALVTVSAMKDKGAPEILDTDGSRSDIGMYGGPAGSF